MNKKLLTILIIHSLLSFYMQKVNATTNIADHNLLKSEDVKNENSPTSLACDPVRDRNALIAIYNALDGPNWNNNTNWNTTAPIEDWFGVTVNSGGCVVGLDLNPTNDLAGANNLSGIIPNEIGDLTELISLDLSIGTITGVIPGVITNLENLVNLNLFSNDISGEIPNDIDKLTKLQFLQLSQNKLTGTIPIAITKLTELRHLLLRVNNLSGTIPIEITNMINLYGLQLDSNNFTGFIYPEYGNLINLRSLSLSDNDLTGIIPSTLGNLTEMRDLRLGRQHLTGTLPPELGNLTKLDWIVIERTDITGEIPKEYGNWVEIRFVALDANKLTGEIPSTFGNLKKIEDLFLRDNELTGTLPATFGNLTTMRKFDVAYNKLDGSLPTTLSSWKSLETFNIINNSFEGTIPDFTGASSLVRLFFYDNLFQFGDFETEHVAYTSVARYDNNPQAKLDTEDSLELNAGDNTTFTTNCSGTQNKYQWYKDDVALTDGGSFTGTNTATLQLRDIKVTDAGTYYCEVANGIVTDLILTRNDIILRVNAVATAPNCTQLTTPSDNATEVALNVNLTWGSVSDATEYHISIGTSSGSSDILNDFDIGNVTTYTPTTNWLEDTTYYVKIVAYNGVLAATGCSETSFTTIKVITAPNCTQLTMPSDNATEVVLNVNLTWGSVSDATEYHISIGTSSGSSDILNDFNVGNVTTYIPNTNWLEDTAYYVKIVAYNGVLPSTGCSETSFTTKKPVIPTAGINIPKFFTPNNDGANDTWLIEDAESLILEIFVFDRFGKLLANLRSNKGWDGTYSGRSLQNDDYWYVISLKSGEKLKGHFSLIRK